MSNSEDKSTYARKALEEFRRLESLTLDEHRSEAVARRRDRGCRTARQNLDDLCDEGSFVEYGQLAVAAQRQRREIDELREKTAADGAIVGIARVNSSVVGDAAARTAVVINDYTVLAGTQGYFHHRKVDRIIEVAGRECVPIVMYPEGGGGRPGDTDITTQISSLNVTTFARWAGLAGKVPRIAVGNGYCFAGNAALFGAADIRIATRNTWLGMAGPAMIEGGGLGKHAPTDIGPAPQQAALGVVDILADDEQDATAIAKTVLGYFQGAVESAGCADQALLRDILPDDRRFSYRIRDLIGILADTDSFTELTRDHGGAIVTGFMRIDGAPLAVIANDCRVLGGAIDASAGRKAARFLRMCDAFRLPVVALVDTPGFMVGPGSEAEGAVLHTSDMFLAGAGLSVPLVGVCVRKGYGLGAMAMMAGGFAEPVITVAWPTGEFGAMGLEGAVELGFRKELDAEPDQSRREALFERLVGEMYEKGKATEVASLLEIDAVIDPADTRDVIRRSVLS